MQRFSLFLTFFIIAFVAAIVLAGSYGISFYQLVTHAESFSENSNPFEVFDLFFNPVTIISFAVTAIFGLLYRIAGIVAVARHQTVSGGEKALWVIGFLIMGFITGIIYIILARQRGFAE